jgi:hypothetical protein
MTVCVAKMLAELDWSGFPEGLGSKKGKEKLHGTGKYEFSGTFCRGVSRGLQRWLGKCEIVFGEGGSDSRSVRVSAGVERIDGAGLRID